MACNTNAQNVLDDFEGSGGITTWYGDNCLVNTNRNNPYPQGINTSNKVLEYFDNGGQYANVRFDMSTNLDLITKNSFSIKIYVPSSDITGSQPNQVSLKLQDGSLAEPWITQTEIIKPIVLNQWQELTFDFENDPFMNLDGSSPAPLFRTDFNRVLIQVNGENNNDNVRAYIDDVSHYDTVIDDPIFDTLVWSDEFDGASLDASKWWRQTQLPPGGSWYNGEIQHYTNRDVNSSVNNGILSINAIKELGYTDQGYSKDYTSARLNSKFAFTYGKVEVRAKLPTGPGTWPAIWMLGKNINEDGAYWDNQGYDTTGWPACGEIDIMEHWGTNQNFIQSAMHTPSSFGNTDNKGGQVIPTVSNGFHVYSVEWTPEKMVFRVDGVKHYEYNPAIKNASTWPFDEEQYLLLNVAILPEIHSNFTSSAMDIDYVRVYQQSTLSNHENGLDRVSIYPNPVRNVLNLKLKNTSLAISNLSITDLNGRIVYENNTYNAIQNMRYNLSALQSGVYITQVSFSNGTKETHKFIKQ
ncbi:family 16 glycosylhydrolase [Ichthyenterobacterium sp. W332]|uniref:Family 16 glycosylhydrolase n=1 Tax=Microcosmobacter mediterraneus TaxID=3075607 RepID=A0ABU2YG72_9FLAO|nr:family 16 glycosylhydrolase [Ichthyenterobacterium sp. W332]MDT0557184.1 family 16 glycosylhydrolase [Ichthyenterobacterium sp. W332]